MDAAVQEAKLLRQVNALIVAHLRDQNLTQAAAAVAAATMTPVSDAAALPNHLLRLVAKVLPSLHPSPSGLMRPGPKPFAAPVGWLVSQGLAVEQEEAARGGGAPAAFDSAAAAGGGGLPRPLGTNAVDFR